MKIVCNAKHDRRQFSGQQPGTKSGHRPVDHPVVNRPSRFPIRFTWELSPPCSWGGHPGRLSTLRGRRNKSSGPGRTAPPVPAPIRPASPIMVLARPTSNPNRKGFRICLFSTEKRRSIGQPPGRIAAVGLPITARQPLVNCPLCSSDRFIWGYLAFVLQKTIAGWFVFGPIGGEDEKSCS